MMRIDATSPVAEVIENHAWRYAGRMPELIEIAMGLEVLTHYIEVTVSAA